ncbi:hypothetical protein BGZ54_003557 [Gamsiella multidivaricata]|nr:hypothetical protein BGZ54_003557 [Gamsiella multidivaricata]
MVAVVLVCVGKKLKTAVVTTYDPHVSSHFLSPSCGLQYLNPNAKWFINLASLTDIRLASISRSYRCFPYGKMTKELSIQTNDGRNTVLRASKNVELERWYFILYKIWKYQQQLTKSEAVESLLHARQPAAAHQQSAQLFEKYLKKQYPDPQQGHQQRRRMSSSSHLCPLQGTSKESFHKHQFPARTRASAFIPQCIGWSLLEQGGENEALEGFISFFRGAHFTAGERGRPSLERHSSWGYQRQSKGSASVATGRRDNGALMRPSSGGMVRQRFGCSAVNSMEPGKAAIIDSWRRRLVMPVFVEEAISMRSSNDGDHSSIEAREMEGILITHANQQDLDSASALADLHPNSRDLESTFKYSSVGNDFGMLSYEEGYKSREQDPLQGYTKRCVSMDKGKDDYNTSVNDRTLYLQRYDREQNFKGSKRSSHIPELDVSLQAKGDEPASLRRGDDHCNQDGTVQDLIIFLVIIPRAPKEEEEEEELPLGLIHVSRYPQWLNTQLSSEDGASVTQP